MIFHDYISETVFAELACWKFRGRPEVQSASITLLASCSQLH